MIEAGGDLSLIDEGRLPPKMRLIVRLIGIADTLRLMRARPGLRIYVPQRAEQAAALREIISPEAVAALCREYPGIELSVPKPDAIVRQWRDAAIRAEADAGATIPQLARHYDLTRRQVHNILHDADRDAPDPCGDLFDGRGVARVG